MIFSTVIISFLTLTSAAELVRRGKGGKGKGKKNTFSVEAFSELNFTGNQNTISFDLDDVESGASLCENTSMNFQSCTWTLDSKITSKIGSTICFHDDYNCDGETQCFKVRDGSVAEFAPPKKRRGKGKGKGKDENSTSDKAAPRYSISITAA
jgi:hypothetical protein